MFIFKDLVFSEQMTTVKKIKLNSIKQLIDLNGDKVNFDLNVQVSSENKAHFDALVVTQKMLDSEQELVYKKVEDGVMSINISNDKGVYENYLLLLKSEKPVNCEIKIDIKDIPYNPEHEIKRKNEIIAQQNAMAQQQNAMAQQQNAIAQQQNGLGQQNIPRQNIPQQNAPQQTVQQNAPPVVGPPVQKEVSKKKGGINIRLILTIIIIGAGGALLWYLFKKKKIFNKPSPKVDQSSLLNYMSSKPQEISIQAPPPSLAPSLAPSPAIMQLPVEIPAPAPSTILPSQNIQSMINENLLSKLNNIPIY
jgi:hypothetical protein